MGWKNGRSKIVTSLYVMDVCADRTDGWTDAKTGEENER